jgi:flagellar basal body P-ring protein FlgI
MYGATFVPASNKIVFRSQSRSKIKTRRSFYGGLKTRLIRYNLVLGLKGRASASPKKCQFEF